MNYTIFPILLINHTNLGGGGDFKKRGDDFSKKIHTPVFPQNVSIFSLKVLRRNPYNTIKLV